MRFDFLERPYDFIRAIFLVVESAGGIFATIKRLYQIYRSEGYVKLLYKVKSYLLHSSYPKWIKHYDLVTDNVRDCLLSKSDKFNVKPKISVLIPTYNPKIEWLEEVIDSVRNQIYENWELCIADDASTDERVIETLRKYQQLDKRIKVVYRKVNGHISATSNSALEVVEGEWVALLDHDDLLNEAALVWVVDAINNNPDIKLIYSDEDRINSKGVRYSPYFKCDWNRDLFYSQNMFSHLGVFRTDILSKVKGFRLGMEGSQDYDLVLRCLEYTADNEIYHIPKVLYHWRVHSESTALSLDAKPYAVIAGEKALNDYFQRSNIKSSAEFVGNGYRVRYLIDGEQPKVTIIITVKSDIKYVPRLINDILLNSEYKNVELMVFSRESYEEDLKSICEKFIKNEKVSFHSYKNYGYLEKNNLVNISKGEYICFINSTIGVKDPDWLNELLGIAAQEKVGFVGPKILYTNDDVKSLGLILGVNNFVGFASNKLSGNSVGYHGRGSLISGFSVISDECMMIRKSIFLFAGGFNEQEYQTLGNEMDFCLRLKQQSFRNICTPYSQVYSHSDEEKIEFSENDSLAFHDIELLKERYKTYFLSDPAYSPNLTNDRCCFTLAWPPRVPAC